jgi:hypothetical protein
MQDEICSACLLRVQTEALDQTSSVFSHASSTNEDEVRFVAVDKCEMCWTIALSWCGSSFDDLVQKRRQGDSKFSLEWKEAEDTAGALESGEDPGKLFPNPTVVRTMKRSGMRVTGTYWFLTVKEYRQKFHFDPKRMKETLVDIEDEENLKVLRGILVKPSYGDNMDLYRKVELFSEKCWVVDETIVPTYRLSEHCLKKAGFRVLFKNLPAHTVCLQSGLFGKGLQWSKPLLPKTHMQRTRRLQHKCPVDA